MELKFASQLQYYNLKHINFVLFTWHLQYICTTFKIEQ